MVAKSHHNLLDCFPSIKSSFLFLIELKDIDNSLNHKVWNTVHVEKFRISDHKVWYHSDIGVYFFPVV
jgi:hypothetical protein